MESLEKYLLPKQALLAIAVSVASLNSFAQQEQEEPTLEIVEVVADLDRFGATKSALPIVETSRSISIETLDQIIDKGALNLSQSVTYLANVGGESFGFATRTDSVYSRGIRVPRYRDSIQELFGSYNTTRAEVYTVEQIELLKGPSSVLYGQGTPGGILNVVSKTPKKENDLEVIAELGNFDRSVFAFDANYAVPNTNDTVFTRLVAYWRDADTQVDFVEDDSLVIMPSITFAPSEDTEITFIAQIQDTNAGTGAQFVPLEGTLNPLPDGSFLNDQDVFVGSPGLDKFETESEQFTLLFNHQFSESVGIEATALHRSGEADYDQTWVTFSQNASGTRYANGYPNLTDTPEYASTVAPRTFFYTENESEQQALDIRLKLNFTTGPLDHDITAGLQYQNVKVENDNLFAAGGGDLSIDPATFQVVLANNQFLLDLNNPVYTAAPTREEAVAIGAAFPIADIANFIFSDSFDEQTTEDYGLYFSNQISLDNWRFNLGLRYDSVTNETTGGRRVYVQGDFVTPNERTVVANTPFDNTDEEFSTNVGVLYAFESGVSPYFNFSESFETVVGTDFQGNPLKPELSEQIELGVKYEPEWFKGIITAAVFDTEITNLDNPDSLPQTASQQQGESSIQGAELEATGYLGEWFIQAAASVLDTEDPNGYQLSAVAEQQASLWAMWEPTVYGLDGFKLGLGVRHFGETVSENAVVRYATPNYTLGDLLLGYEIDNWDIALNVRNIEDKEYLTSCLTRGDCFPGVRRTAVLRVTYNL